MKQITKYVAPLALCASFGVQADIVGGSIEATYWYAGVSGDASTSSGAQTVDMESDLGFGKDSFFELAATLEHPIPVLPNVRIKYADLDQTEEGTFSTTFDGVSGDVETNLDLSHVDLMLYYEILDTYLSVDIGLDIKVFDGQLEIQEKTSTTVSTTKIDEILPLLYVSTEVELPLTDLSFGAEVSGVSYSGNSLYDGKVRFRQGFSLAFVELGYRQMAINVEDLSDTDVDIEFSGVYLSTGLDF